METQKTAAEVTTITSAKSLMQVQNNYINSIGKGLESLVGSMSTYQALCGYNILNAINVLLAKTGLNHYSKGVDKESINNAIKYAIVYQLNTDNREVFVIARNEKREFYDEKTKSNKQYWIKTIEYKPQYKGHLKLLAAFGDKVKKVYPEWIVREGDEFKYPKMVGVQVQPPEWCKKDSGHGKILRVVVPVEFEDGYIDYRIAERDSVAVNLKAQIKQTLQGEKDIDNTKKEQILTLIKDMDLDTLLSESSVSSYVNSTYTGISSEEMIITKLVINATKRIPINYEKALPKDSGQARQLVENTYDNSDVYKKSDTTPEIKYNKAPELLGVETENEITEKTDDSNKAVETKKDDDIELPPSPDEIEKTDDEIIKEIFG